MVEGGAGNYLIFPNLMIIDGWRVFRTFYPSSPDYMEINGWACLPKEDSPALRKARLDWYLAFQGPGGFATPDDVEGLEGCQMGFATYKEVEWSDISRGMKSNTAGGPGELQMRVFWREWNARMTTGRACRLHRRLAFDRFPRAAAAKRCCGEFREEITGRQTGFREGSVLTTATFDVTREQVEDFLYAEADLLDNWQLNEWIALFDQERGGYYIPTTDAPDATPITRYF